MGMHMHEKRRFHPHNYCGSGGVFAYLSDELSCYYSLRTSTVQFFYMFMDRSLALWWRKRFMTHTVSSI